MRLRFGELSPAEVELRQRCCALAGEAWRHVASADYGQALGVLEQIEPTLQLRVESSVVDAARVVQLSALESELWPLVELLLEQAPHDFAHALSLGRSALPLGQALQEIQSVYALDLAHARVRAGFSRGHLLEITLSVPGGVGSENEQIAAENLVLGLLGERLFETWIGAVHVVAAPRAGPLRVLDVHAPKSELGLHELFDTVAAAARGVLQGLPAESRAAQARASTGALESQADWVMLELEPLVDGSQSDLRKQDLVLASTSTPELLRCYLDGSPCSSRRFSRVGEQFVFVSYEDEQTSPSARLARRAELEAALNESLQGVGVVTGVGLGVRTTYLDLALCNLETGLGRLVSKLRSLGVPRRSLIQFFDSELADEWLSIWPDSRVSAG